MGGVCSCATYKSTEPPVVSTLSELLSKQLISVLGGRCNGGHYPTAGTRGELDVARGLTGCEQERKRVERQAGPL
jgi:hypothetical protein